MPETIPIFVCLIFVCIILAVILIFILMLNLQMKTNKRVLLQGVFGVGNIEITDSASGVKYTVALEVLSKEALKEEASKDFSLRLINKK